MIPKQLQNPEFRFVLINKGSKVPLEENWQETGNHPFDDKILLNHLEKGGNYGIVGGFGNLVIIDCDKKAIEERVEALLPKTFKVRTGREGAHYYYYCKDITAPIRLTETIAGDVGDVQWQGKQVVAPGSTHKNGKQYLVEQDKEIATVSIQQIKLAIAPWISKEKEKEVEIIAQDNSLKILDVVDVSKLKKHGEEYYGAHPLHGSDSGMNFWINPSKNCWHCFRHDSGGGPLSYIAVKEGIIDCAQSISGALRGDNYKNTFAKAIEKYGMKEVIIKFDSKPIEKEKVVKQEEWEFQNLLPKEHFITKYIEKGQSLSDAYPEYFFMSALNALSMAANRRIRIELSPKAHYTNIWGICVGKSTISRKSTAINLNRNILITAGLIKKIPADDSTPEAFIDQLKTDAQLNLLKDEFGLFLSKARLKYQTGIDSLLSTMYDCPDFYERDLRKEKITAENVYLSLLGAMVPDQLSRNASMDDILSGFFPRILFVCPERAKERKKLRHLTESDNNLELELVVWIKKLFALTDALKDQDTFLHVVFTEGALELYNNWCAIWEQKIFEGGDDSDFSPFFGRQSICALKVAALFCLGSEKVKKLLDEFSSFSNVSIINSICKISKDTYYEFHEAENFTNITNSSFGENGKRFPPLLIVGEKELSLSLAYFDNMFLPYAQKVLYEVESQQTDKELDRIYRIAVKHCKNGCVEHSDLLRKANIKSKDFLEYVKTLQESGRFHVSIDGNSKTIYTPLKTE